MGKAINIFGQRFGRLSVLDRGENKGKQYGWICICDCGKTVNVNGNSLRSGRTKSCGCLRAESLSQLAKKHGLVNSPEYGVWQAMKKRCYDAKNSDYARYGGRGITVCDRWINSFENFISDMGKRPNGYSIDRINVDGNYEPSNCKWASSVEQANNKSNNAKYTYGAETHTIAEWAKIGSIPQTLLRTRLVKGMKLPYALYNIDYRTVNV